MSRAYTFCLMAVAIALPLSNPLMSVATGLLGAVWIGDMVLNKGGANRWAHARGPGVVALGLVGLYALHVLGMAWSSDVNYGLHDLNAKLPMLALGLAGAFSLEHAMPRKVLISFLVAVLLALGGLVANAALFMPELGSGRGVSVYISHVRFGMMLAFAVVVARSLAGDKRWWAAVLLAVVAGLWWMQAVTGFVLLAALLPWWALPRAWSSRRKLWIGATGGVTIALAAAVFLAVGPSMASPPADVSQLPTHSAAGEQYVHVDGTHTQENGHWVWVEVAWGELAHAWNQRSTLNFNGENLKGAPLSGTLIRFLASKGAQKDALGVAALTDEEVAAIEAGVPSIVELHGSGLVVRWNRFQFAMGRWQDGQGVGGSSALQRLEHLRAAWAVVQTSPWVGVGSGDVAQATARGYEAIDSQLAPAYRHRAHNQYLALWEAFGVTGPVLLIALLVFAVHLGLRRDDGSGDADDSGNLLVAFTVMLALAFLTEDTLETQSGVTLVAWGLVLLSGGGREGE